MFFLPHTLIIRYELTIVHKFCEQQALALAECGGEANFNRAAALFQEHILLGQEEDEVSDPRNYFELGRILQKNQKADEAIDIYKVLTVAIVVTRLYLFALFNIVVFKV